MRLLKVARRADGEHLQHQLALATQAQQHDELLDAILVYARPAQPVATDVVADADGLARPAGLWKPVAGPLVGAGMQAAAEVVVLIEPAQQGP